MFCCSLQNVHLNFCMIIFYTLLFFAKIRLQLLNMHDTFGLRISIEIPHRQFFYEN